MKGENVKSEVRVDFPKDAGFNYTPNDNNGEYLMVWWYIKDSAEVAAHLRAQGVTPSKGHRWCKSYDESGILATLLAGTPASLHQESEFQYVAVWISRNAACELLGAMESANSH